MAESFHVPNEPRVLPASTAAHPLTSNPPHPPQGFRTPHALMAELPRRLVKMATFGFLPREDQGIAFSVPSVEAVTSDAQARGTQAAAQSSAGAAETAAVPAEGVRGVGNVFTYVTSKWAILCLFMTVLLNRTLIYASLRRPIELPFKVRLIMRIVPVMLFVQQIFSIMFAMRCQTSPVFQGEREYEVNKGTSNGLFWQIGRMGSWWMDDRGVCETIGMIPDAEWIEAASDIKDTDKPESELDRPSGSLALLWPLYKTLSLSQFVEVFSCALTGRVPAAETGMTLLEHSLAFAEAEALASRKTYRLETTEEGVDDENQHHFFKIRGEKLVPPEVLYISLMSSLGHITSHVLGMLNKQSQYRLLSTGFFGLAFLGGFALALLRGGMHGILDFPTVCVVGFIPHLLIFCGIAICGAIYLLALLLASLFPHSGRRSFSEGLENLRANLSLQSFTVSFSEDFYTALLRLGLQCLTLASEATYLNEGGAVTLPGWTWLEGERAKLLDSQRGTGQNMGELINTGRGAGPYSKERKEVKNVVENGKKKRRVGGGKWAGAAEMLRGVGVVLVRWGVVGAGRAFSRPPRRQPHAPQESEAVQGDDEMDVTARRLYSSFLHGAVEEEDESADFVPSSTVSSDSEYQSDDNSSQGTPTASPRRRRTRQSSTDDNALAGLFETPARLASLLDPQTPEDRSTAKILAKHLTAPRVLTRDAFLAANRPLQGAAEESTLESVLLSRRKQVAVERSIADGREDDTESSGGGPVCVICQSAPRTIIVWPCRCLALCEDCRVTLALNNFGNCVTCRRELDGFSRIYIP